jgi:hypothetical protein
MEPVVMYCKEEIRREYAASTSCRPSARVVNRCPSRYRPCMSRVFCLSAVTVLARLDGVGQIPLPTRYSLDRYSAPYHTDGHPPPDATPNSSRHTRRGSPSLPHIEADETIGENRTTAHHRYRRLVAFREKPLAEQCWQRSTF